MDSAVLVLSYGVVAFIVSDFVLARIGLRDTTTNERPGARPPWLVAHAGVVGLLLLPVALIFGLRGLAFALTVAVAHLLIDAVAVTMRARTDADGPTDPLGWAPSRTTSLLLQIIGHAAVLAVAWWIWLAGASESVAGWIASFAGARDAASATQVLNGIAVMAALVLVNAFLGSRFVLSIVPPLTHAKDSGPAGVAPEADTVSAIVGVLERIIVAVLVVGHGEAAAALVLAAKELSRRQRVEADARFAEHYLIGTLASFGFAVVTGYVARVALEAIT